MNYLKTVQKDTALSKIMTKMSYPMIYIKFFTKINMKSYSADTKFKLFFIHSHSRLLLNIGIFRK